jgi:hypothetical protein
VVEAYHSKTDCDIVVGAHDSDWRVQLLPPPTRPHPAYDPGRISYKTVLAHSELEFRRAVRKAIGPIVRPDDPETELCMPLPAGFDPEVMRKTLDDCLRDSHAGSILGMSADGSRLTLKILVTNMPRFEFQLTRLLRRFPIPAGLKFYRYNEARKYEFPLRLGLPSQP